MHSSRPSLAALLVLLAGLTGAAQAVVAPAPTYQSSTAQVQAAPQKAPSTRVAQAGSSNRVLVEARPIWSDLSSQQQQALRPLASTWASLSEPHKRKWIALSRNFQQLSPQEQAMLHSRMNEWVALSPQQRATARLNFAETKGLAADDKKAKWEAYQALSAEEKKKLAAGAPRRTPATPAAAVRPVPAQRLATVPRSDNRDVKPPRIATGPAVANTPLAQPPQPAEHSN